MMYRYVKPWIYYFWLPLFVDRISKYLVVADIVSDQQVLPFLDVYVTYNRGISWGVGNCDHQGLFVLISCIVAAVIVGFCWYMYKMRMQGMAQAACLMILSGAVSNFFDRLWFCGVVDFIRFYYLEWSFPVFNFADVFIFCGTLLFLYVQIRDDFF